MEHAADDREGLAEPAKPIGRPCAERESVGRVFAIEPGGTDPEDGAALAHVVKRGGNLGRHGRFPERVRPDHQPNPDPLGRHGPAGQDGPALEDRTLPRPNDRVQVIPGPQGVEPEPFGPDPGVEHRGPRRVLVPAERAKADRRHEGPRCYRVIGKRRARRAVPRPPGSPRITPGWGSCKCPYGTASEPEVARPAAHGLRRLRRVRRGQPGPRPPADSRGHGAVRIHPDMNPSSGRCRITTRVGTEWGPMPAVRARQRLGRHPSPLRHPESRA